jgi:putative transposase
MVTQAESNDAFQDLINAATLASRLGVSPVYIKRRLREKRIASVATAGREHTRLFLREAAEAALADLRVKRGVDVIDVPAPLPAPLVAPSADAKVAAAAELSDAQRATAAARFEILGQFEKFEELGVCGNLHDAADRFARLYKVGEVPVARETLRLEPSLSGRTLRRWRDALKRCGPAALAPAFGNRRGSGIVDQRRDFQQFLEAGIAQWGDRFHPRRARELMAVKFAGERLPSIGAIGRWFRRYRHQNPAALAAWENRDHFRSHFAAKFGTHSDRATRPGQIVGLDGSPDAVEPLDGARVHLLVARDYFSEWIGGELVSESISGVLLLIRNVAFNLCVPETFEVDWGAPFISEKTERAAAAIGSRIARVRKPYAPELKGPTESAVKVLQRLRELEPGFRGHTVSQKQALRSRLGFQERRALTQAQIAGARLTLEQARSRLRELLLAENNRPRASLGGRSPNQIIAEFSDLPRVSDRRALDVALLPLESRTVGREGIHFAGGLYGAAELGPMVGDKVLVARDVDDVGRLVVFAERQHHARQFVCVAVDLDRLGASRKELAVAARQLQRQAVTAYRTHLRKLKRRIKPELIADELRRRGAEAGERALALLPPGVSHTTPALEAAAEAARALDCLAAPRARVKPPLIDFERADIDRELAEEEARLARFAAVLNAADPLALPAAEISYACGVCELPEVIARHGRGSIRRLMAMLRARRDSGIIEEPDGWAPVLWKKFESEEAQPDAL